MLNFLGYYTDKEIAVICAFISAIATILVGVIALYANNKIADTSTKFLEEHKTLLHEAVRENIKQNELALRNKIFEEINKYYNSVGDFYRLFVTEHFPGNLSAAICEYEDSKDKLGQISDIRFMNFLEKEIVMTIKANHLLRSTRFYIDSTFDLVMAFDDYRQKFNSIKGMVGNQEICCDHALYEQNIIEVKEVYNNISHKFLTYIQDVESLITKIDDSSISFVELDVFLRKLCENKKIIRKKLHEEYAKRGANDE